MNTRLSIMVSIFAPLALLMTPVASFADFVSGSTGVDGDFTPMTNTVLLIPESGVLNYGIVNIPTGVTVTFTKNSANTPITILATGDVAINGTISVNGLNGSYIVGGAGGPGGFSGGTGGTTYQIGRRGEGPGGGNGGSPRTDSSSYGGGGGGGSYATTGGTGQYINNVSSGSGGATYGNDRLLPLIGGSGGGGGGGTNTYVGGAGGGGSGAIVIASSGTITVNGSITANGGAGDRGGNPNSGAGGGAGGSGGGIRLIANIIAGNGSITATGGGGGDNYNNGGGGGSGRIRFEASSVTRTASTNPPFSLGYPYAAVPSNMPVLTIASIGGISSPSVPKGSYSTPDVILPFNTQNPVSIVLTGSNIPIGTTVTVKSTPPVGTQTTTTANLSGPDVSATTATASLTISYAYPSIITASVTFQLAAVGVGPFYADGERVDRIMVATSLGGKSTITYITESGREIPAVM